MPKEDGGKKFMCIRCERDIPLKHGSIHADIDAGEGHVAWGDSLRGDCGICRDCVRASKSGR